MLRHYRDIPIALSKLYVQPDYIQQKHGNDLLLTIEGNGLPTEVKSEQKLIAISGQKKKRRQVQLVKDSFNSEEE